jgi:hypothetical protein
MSKPRQPFIVVTGPLLTKALESAAPCKSVSVVRGEHASRMLPADALRLLRCGSFLGKVTASGRLRQITEVDARLFSAVPAYWEGRAVVRFHADQRALPGRVKDGERASLWSRLLALDPPPRAWRREAPHAK